MVVNCALVQYSYFLKTKSNFVFLINNCLLPGLGQVFKCVYLCGCLSCHRRPLFDKCGQSTGVWEVAEKATLGPDTLPELWHTHTHTYRKCHPHLTFSHMWQISEYQNNGPSVFNSLSLSLFMSIRAFDITAQPFLTNAMSRQTSL